MENLPLLMLGLPKGSLEDATIDLFAKAGFEITKSSRSYRPAFDDEQLDGRFVRAQGILIVDSPVRIGFVKMVQI